eukprot:TRINITY_DN2022_c3_g1_i2.p1 TRINITY_DN2022_c3_g1~~TRINITY_DN2022_c3_g1_i2.p1  ORF type:complete len:259 (-),score=76.57 TRINITY_DN2022_c3_g1_i2:113-844(-)
MACAARAAAVCGPRSRGSLSLLLLLLLLQIGVAASAADDLESRRAALSALAASDHREADLRCSACQWSAKALRLALSERMPKRVKSRAKRRDLAASVLRGEASSAKAQSGVCEAKRFPEDPVVTGATQETLLRPETAERRKISDLLEVRGGKQAPIRGEHMLLLSSKQDALSRLQSTCTTLMQALESEIIGRVEAHDGRVFNAISDRWLCVRKAQLCAASEIEGGDDDEDEEEDSGSTLDADL